MVDIIHRIGIHAPPQRVHQALATIDGLAGWWTEEVRGDTRPGGRIDFAFRAPDGSLKGAMTMEVQRAAAPTAVHWRCVDGPEEWVGTEVDFDLAPGDDGQTIVSFGHRKWREAIDFTAHCSTKWAVFLLSLRELVEHGTGKPSPRDLKIDDWN